MAQRLNCLPARPGFYPWVRKIPWRRKWQPTPVFLPGEPHGWRRLVVYSLWCRKESDSTERLHFHYYLHKCGRIAVRFNTLVKKHKNFLGSKIYFPAIHPNICPSIHPSNHPPIHSHIPFYVTLHPSSHYKAGTWGQQGWSEECLTYSKLATGCECSVVFNFCDPMDYNPPGSSIHGTSQVRILEWVAISFSRGSAQPRDWTCVSCVSCIGRWILLPLSHMGSPGLQ